jgi:hypothetical protein
MLSYGVYPVPSCLFDLCGFPEFMINLVGGNGTIDQIKSYKKWGKYYICPIFKTNSN